MSDESDCKACERACIPSVPDAQGSIIRTIPVRALERLDIAVPDIPTQRRIVAFDALMRREKRFLRRLAERRERLFGATLERAAKNANQKGGTG